MGGFLSLLQLLLDFALILQMLQSHLGTVIWIKREKNTRQEVIAIKKKTIDYENIAAITYIL